MPQVDLETIVCGGDRKIACESLIVDQQSLPDKSDTAEAPSDFPEESFQLREEEELDWFDRNAFYFNERKDSQKGNSNPSSISNHNHNHNHNSNPNSSSQRFSLNLTTNTSIIGLPKPQKSSFLNSKSRRRGRPPRPRFFPKRPSRSGKSLTLTEPSSPTVSCIGRVRSNRNKNRRCASGRRPTEVNFKPEKKTGFWACLKAILLFNCGNGSGVNIEERQRPNNSPSPSPSPSSSPPRWSFAEREQKIPASAPLGEPPGLGGMKRFASGRKSESWVDTDLDFEDSDAPDQKQESICRRRALDPPKKISSFRDWECEGPASV